MPDLKFKEDGTADWRTYQDELMKSTNQEEAALGRRMRMEDDKARGLSELGTRMDADRKELDERHAQGRADFRAKQFNDASAKYNATNKYAKTGNIADHPLAQGQNDGASLYKGGKNNKFEFGKEQALHGIGGRGGGGSFVRRHKEKIIFLSGGLGAFLIVAAVVVILLMTLAPYKHVHFATVLRSLGMARFTYVMNKQMSRTIFDSAVLTKNSTGRFTPPPSSLFHRLVGINPRKQLAQLGHQNKLRFDFSSTPRWGGVLGNTNTFQGVTIDGQKIYLDDTARSLYGRDYNDLNRREARRARSVFATQARTELSRALVLESRRFRWAAFTNFYRVTGIKLFKWGSKGATYKLKTDAQARALNLDETYKRVVGGEGGIKRTGVTSIDEEAEAKRKAQLEAARNNTEPGEQRSRLAKSVTGVRALSSGVAAVTIACVVHAIDGAFEAAALEREQRVARTNNDTQSGSDQIKYGDTQQQAVGAVSRTWDGAEQSAMYKKFEQKPMDAEDKEEIRAAPGVNTGSQKFAEVIDIADKILVGSSLAATLGGDALQDAGCNVLLNQWVQFGIVGAEAAFVIGTAGAGGGLLAAIQATVRTALEVGASVGIAHVIGTLIDDAVKAASDTDFSGTSFGADKFNENFVASSYTGEIGNRQITFGAPLDAKDAEEAQLQAVSELRDYYSKQPFKTRYFAIDNPFSLTGHIVAHTPSSLGGIAESIQRGVVSLATIIGSPQRLFSSAANLLTANGPVASAEASITRGDRFGIDEWGWTVQEQRIVEEDPAFEVANPEGNDLIHSIEPRLEELNQKYGPCYAPGYVLQSQKPETGCTKAALTTTEALKWRTYMSYSYSAARLTGNI